MKKMLVVIMTVVLMVVGMTVASANNDRIWDDVYEFYKSTDEYSMFINTEYDHDGFVKDDIAYYAGYNMSLFYDEYHTLSEIEEYAEKISEETDLANVNVDVNIIGGNRYGQYVLEVRINSTDDWTKNEKTNCNFDEPVYGCCLVCYDRMYIPD